MTATATTAAENKTVARKLTDLLLYLEKTEYSLFDFQIKTVGKNLQIFPNDFMRFIGTFHSESVLLLSKGNSIRAWSLDEWNVERVKTLES